MVEEVTAQVAAQVRRSTENPPEFIYFLTLYHLFRDFMEDDERQRRRRPQVRESVVWNSSTTSRRTPSWAPSASWKLPGCIIADSVGLGKTCRALARHEVLPGRNDRILVLCPEAPA